MIHHNNLPPSAATTLLPGAMPVAPVARASANPPTVEVFIDNHVPSALRLGPSGAGETRVQPFAPPPPSPFTKLLLETNCICFLVLIIATVIFTLVMIALHFAGYVR